MTYKLVHSATTLHILLLQPSCPLPQRFALSFDILFYFSVRKHHIYTFVRPAPLYMTTSYNNTNSHIVIAFLSSPQLKLRVRPPWSPCYLPTSEATSPHHSQQTILQSKTSPRSSCRAPKLVHPRWKSTASKPGTTLLLRSLTKASRSPLSYCPSWA